MTLQIHPIDDRLSYARQIVRGEAAALLSVADRLDESFLAAVELFHRCPGRICITGTGKSADVGQKIAGTFNSTGTRAYSLDATRAVHGDLGMIHQQDVVLALSLSGETEEMVKLLPSLRQMAMALVGLTSNAQSTLAKNSDVALILGPLEEVCPLGLAPSTSTTAMIAVGDALAFVLMRMREFTHEDFARFHPAGSLGRKLLKVEAVMRQGNDLRVSHSKRTIREVFAQEKRLGRRTGAVMLTDDDGKLSGLFTDSDLARLFEQHRDAAFDRPIRDVMTPAPLKVPIGTRISDAVDILRNRKISELPVVDAFGKPVGLIDITDLIGLVTREEAEDALSRGGMMVNMKDALPQRCARIEMLVLDVDGVLTDGCIRYTDQGAEIKAFHVRDGSGLKLWTTLGKKAGIITGRRSAIVQRRADELGIQAVVQGADDKKTALLQMLMAQGVTTEQTCAIGDDIVDLPMLRACGLAVAVADACLEAMEDADYVTQAAGGRGAVRETIEWILRAQGSWQAIVARYRND